MAWHSPAHSTRPGTIAMVGLLVATLVAVAVPPAHADAGRAAGLAPQMPVPSAIVPGSVGRSSYELDATYDATLRVGWATRSVQVGETIALTNTSGTEIDRLELNAVPARLGRMVLGPVSVDGSVVPATISDQTIMVPLGGILPPGESATVRLSYRATLRTTTSGSDWMFTQRNGIADLYRWLPWISRRTAFSRPSFGDPFFTPVSRSVRVTIQTDRRLRIAMNGRRTALSADARTQTWQLANVRDVIISMAPDYRITTATIDGITTRVYTRPGGLSASALLSAARPALQRFADRLGRYPYPQFTIAESAGGWAMEGPGVIWIPRGTAGSRIRFLVSHEIAHQWFYGIVGSDQPAQPFADEAVAEFMARSLLGSWRSPRCAADNLDRTVYGYSSSCFYETVYVQGANFLRYIQGRMGSTAFWRALRAHVVAERFGVARTQDLLDRLDAATPQNLRSLYERRFPRYY